ncbi:hypothetical protein OPQ81_008567 [Rhizoctonia solani]|nr:hypothetical protein OPQ81_008567 [Rhizoctonia solani]
MPRFPFIQRTPVPGASYLVSNTFTKDERGSLGFENPVRIQFSTSGHASESLSDWCQRHQHVSVQSMQLRKEQAAPFHEYIAFSLGDDAGHASYFRIDRRQLSNGVPSLGCTGDEGFGALDTIEEIMELEHSTYSPSDCLVQLDFTEDVRLALIIDICREISQHDMATFYTPQRYNCYFYAQTILLCTLCKQYEWYNNFIWGSGKLYSNNEDVTTGDMPLANLHKASRVTISIQEKKSVRYLVLYRGAATYPLSQQIQPTGSPTECRTLWRAPSRMIRPRRCPQRKGMGIWTSTMKETDIGNVQAYLSGMIRAHGVRVEQYKNVSKCSAWEVERDIKKAMNEIWGGRWWLLGQVDQTLLQPQASSAERYLSKQKGQKNSGKAETEQGSELKRRPRVTRQQGWEREWQIVDVASAAKELYGHLPV